MKPRYTNRLHTTAQRLRMYVVLYNRFPEEEALELVELYASKILHLLDVTEEETPF